MPAASNAAPLMPAERGRRAGGLDRGRADWWQQVPLGTQPDLMHGLRLRGGGVIGSFQCQWGPNSGWTAQLAPPMRAS